MFAEESERNTNDNQTIPTRQSLVLASQHGKRLSFGPLGASTFKVVGAESSDQLLVYETVWLPS